MCNCGSRSAGPTAQRRFTPQGPRVLYAVFDDEGTQLTASFRNIGAAESKRLKLCHAAGVSPCTYTVQPL